MLPTPFDFEDEITEEELELFTECLVYDDYGDVVNYRKFDYMSDILIRALNKEREPLVKSENFVSKYTAGIRANKQIQMNEKAKTELSIVTLDSESGSSNWAYGTVDENMIVYKDELKRFASAETVEDFDAIEYSLGQYDKVKTELEKIEGVDIGVLIVRTLQGIPKAESKLKELTTKYKSLKYLIKHVLEARELGFNVLPDLD